IKKEVVKPSRVMPRPDNGDAINGTIRKAEQAVNSGVNVGMLGALNRAMSGEEATPESTELVSVAYDKPQIVPAPIVKQPVIKQENANDTVVRNGKPTSIEEVEREGYTPASSDKKIPRAFSGNAIQKENTPKEDVEPNYFGNGTQPKPKYEMLKPTLDNPRPAYVDTNPTQGGAMPSEPAPIRQEVTGGQMSRAAIQGTTDIAKQSAKDKESAEMKSRIQNIRQAIKETPSIGQYEAEALRAEKVKSSQNRGLLADEGVRKPEPSRKPEPVRKAEEPAKKQERAPQNNAVQEEAKPIRRRPYAAPPVSLLLPPAPEVDQNEDYDLKKEKIVKTLEFFNIKGEVVEIKVGPTFTMYKLKVEMPRGRTINYISSLENDIAMKMEAGSVRIIAPIPREDAVGIEVPNKIRRNVNLSEIISSPEFNRENDPASFALGKNLYGESRVVNVRKLPHVLIAGATGAGKSCCINSLIVSLLYKASPDDIRLILVDPKRVEMSIYAGIPHLLMDEIICDTDKAIRALNWSIQEMERRMSYFAEVGYRDIESYNAAVSAHGHEKMARIVIVVDEFADLMSTGKKAVEDTVNRIARLARATGIHLVLATQRPSVDVISGTIKNNFPSRVAFKVTSSFDSKTILDSVGADKLLGYGDLLFMSPGANEIERMQGAFISNEEVKKVVDYIKQNNDSYFDNNIKDAIFKEAEEEKPEFSAK
ncbi:MAG: DNA translocase FtsK, partial [Clostridia bacterium]|nr:DNA translocase FtsK [Clostridia bacterium]